jgi:1-acyl-sn-glycerol-3-phosphate acyltransferase
MRDQPKESVVLYLNKRKGFIKLAIQHGSTLVPAFTFGYDGAYNTWMPKDTLNLNHSLGFLPMLFFGRFLGTGHKILPLSIPYPDGPTTIVMGDPIPVKKNENPSSEEIERYHLAFVDGMKTVFEDHKVSCGQGHRNLVIF